MRERVINDIRRHELMRPGDRVAVAVSGGADSVALLRLLLEARAELGIVLSVVHFNHKIRGAEADADEQFVGSLARNFDLEFHCDSADTPAYAKEHKMSLEAAGRKLRYGFFGRLLTSGSRIQTETTHICQNQADVGHPGILDRIATAHTRDDQAETVLMRFLRGAGTRGLAGIFPKLSVSSIQFPEEAAGSCPAVVRPLLEITRAELRSYLEQQGQPWREDATNRDVSFARNRLRHELMPLLMRDYNPALPEVLSDVAEIARAEEAYWEREVRQRLAEVAGPSDVGDQPSAIMVERLLAEPAAMQRRLIRAVAEQHGLRLEFDHVEEVLALARAQASAAEMKVGLPQAWEAVRQERELWFRNRCQESGQQPAYDFALPVGREVEVAGRKVRIAIVSTKDITNDAEGTRATRVLLDAKLAEQRLRVRNWRAGDRYWPAHTKEPKKLKELLQSPHIPRAQKPFWPVVVSPTSAKAGQVWGTGKSSGEEIVWVPGFAAPERFQAAEGSSEALLLEVLPKVPDGTKVQGS